MGKLMRAVMRVAFVVAAGAMPACNCDGGDDGATPDAGVTTSHCPYQPVEANAGAGTAVTPGALMAGAAEVPLDVPVGTGLGGYTARADFLGQIAHVDNRTVAISGAWAPSVGIETRPMVKAVAFKVGSETVLWLKVDAIFAYEPWIFELEDRLGPEYRGKILISTSHSHSAWSQFTGHSPLKVGSGELRKIVHDRFMAGFEAAARAAIADLRPAKIGFYADAGFDTTDQITHERRGENDMLPGGHRKDDHLYLIRLDDDGGQPIAIIPVFGMHGTLNDADSPLASTDAIGGLERVLEERFDRKVIVMHVQSAGADTAPSGHGDLDGDVHPGAAGDPNLPLLKSEGLGRAAVDDMMASWTAAGANMTDTIALSMVTRSIELGPYTDRTYRVRGGALSYAPFDLDRTADGKVYDDGGAIKSPIDEWNAPVGAALCEKSDPALFPAAAIPGTDGLLPYSSCVRLDVAGSVLGDILKLDLSDIGPDRPACQTTRTTISALRLGDYLVTTTPGELSVLLADKIRAASPVDAMHTIAIGYSQGHVGYVLTPEDWLLGGYEPSVTFGGPLEGEYLLERQAELMPLAMAATRPDGAQAGTTRVVRPDVVDTMPIDDPAPMAGTVPAAVPADLWMRSGRPATAQPAAQVPRISGLATFVWYGDDPLVATPVVTLEHETTGVFSTVMRHSRRPVSDGDFLLTYAPSPLIRAGAPQQHIWAVEWQAVPTLGDPVFDRLDERGALETGRYRFHVVGHGWTLDSQPFTIVPGPLGVGASHNGTLVNIAVAYQAPKGYRLLDMNLPSNRNVPLRAQTVQVRAFDGGGNPVGSVQSATTDASGNAVVDYGAAAASITRVNVQDVYGNGADALL